MRGKAGLRARSLGAGRQEKRAGGGFGAHFLICRTARSDAIGFLCLCVELGFRQHPQQPTDLLAPPQSPTRAVPPSRPAVMMNSQSHSNMHVAALQPSLSPQSVTRRATVANDGELYRHRASGATIERAPCADSKVDVQILRKLSASVSHFEGPRKNLSFVVSVETLIPGRRAFSDERESCQLVARSFDDFRRFRRSLLARVGSLHDPSLLLSGRSGKCRCEGDNGCPFDVTRGFLERLKFTRMPFLSLGESEADLTKRQQEMDNFLHIIFAILHRMQPGAWHPECRFLQDVMAFLEVEESFSQQMELLLRAKNRHMNLDGWKAHTLETFGSGIGV